MKTTFLISGMLIISAALSAQTTVKNSDAIKSKTSVQKENGDSRISNSGSASSATTIQSDATQNAKSKSYAEVKKENEAVATEKQTLNAAAKTKEKQIKKEVSQDRSASVSANSNATANASAENNNYSDNTSINSSGKVSSYSLEDGSNKVKKEEKANIKTAVDATAEKTGRVKAVAEKATIKQQKSINAASSTTVKAGASYAHTIHPTPVSVKTRTMVRTNAVINIK